MIVKVGQVVFYLMIRRLMKTLKIWNFSSAKITEQCANLTMAFRTNYHAYVEEYRSIEMRKKNYFVFFRLVPIWMKFVKRPKFD